MQSGYWNEEICLIDRNKYVASIVWVNIFLIAGRGMMKSMRGFGMGSQRGASGIPMPMLQRSKHHPKILELAITAVRAGKMSQVKAAELYGIPQPTISRYITGKTLIEPKRSVPDAYNRPWCTYAICIELESLYKFCFELDATYCNSLRILVDKMWTWMSYLFI